MKYNLLFEDKKINKKILQIGVSTVARKAGYSRVYIYKLMSGENVATQEAYKKILKAVS